MGGKNSLIRVLLVGTFPPPPCGTTILMEQLYRELSNREDVRVSRIGTRTGRTSTPLDRVLSFFGTVLSVFRTAPHVDVITQHGSTYGARFLGPVLLLVARMRGKPFVFRRFAGDFDLEFRRSAPLQRFLLRWLLRSDLVLMETQHLVSHFRRQFPRGRFEWYPNNRPLWTDLRRNRNGDRPARRFVFLGHVMREKGVLELRDAARQMAHLGVQVDLYGPMLSNVSPEDFSGIEGLRYRGELAQEEVPKTLAEYDVLVLPSHREGCPGAILEAYSAGLPVVATRVGGIPEIVDHGETGLLVPRGDVNALTAAMSHLASSGADMRRLKQGAAQRARSFSSERWADDFVLKCRSVIGRNLARNQANEGQR